jgi:hypothetical protein
MSAPTPCIVYADADLAAPVRPVPIPLGSIHELEPLLRRLLHERRDGELVLHGHGTARICIFDGKIAWVRISDYPEHLGDVMRRELGLSKVALRETITHCRATGQRFGEGMVSLKLLEPSELRSCLNLHISDQFSELLMWPGPVTAEHSGWPHRYDHTYTFELDEILERPAELTPPEHHQLGDLVSSCIERLPQLELACMIEAAEGTLLYSAIEHHQGAQDLLSLCTAGVRRLITNRITRADSVPQGIVLAAPDAQIFVQPLPWHPGWLLVLGGRSSLGRLVTVALSAVESADPN